MTRDAAYWSRKSRRDQVIWMLLGWLYLPLLLVPLLFRSVYYGFELSKIMLVRMAERSILIMLYPLCSACFLELNEDSSASSRRKFAYSMFAFIYIGGYLFGVRGTVWYWLHIQLLIALFFARGAVTIQIERGTLQGVPSFQWLDKAIAVMLIGGMALHFHWYTWRLIDVLTGIMLTLLAVTAPTQGLSGSLSSQFRTSRPYRTKLLVICTSDLYHESW